jgi:hypothetical protein
MTRNKSICNENQGQFTAGIFISTLKINFSFVQVPYSELISLLYLFLKFSVFACFLTVDSDIRRFQVRHSLPH